MCSLDKRLINFGSLELVKYLDCSNFKLLSEDRKFFYFECKDCGNNEKRYRKELKRSAWCFENEYSETKPRVLKCSKCFNGKSFISEDLENILKEKNKHLQIKRVSKSDIAGTCLECGFVNIRSSFDIYRIKNKIINCKKCFAPKKDNFKLNSFNILKETSGHIDLECKTCLSKINKRKTVLRRRNTTIELKCPTCLSVKIRNKNKKRKYYPVKQKINKHKRCMGIGCCNLIMSTKKFCSEYCLNIFKFTKIKENNSTISKGNFKKILKNVSSLACDICKSMHVNSLTGVCINHVDHIDSDPSNNVFSNLRMLCPSCHREQTKWGSINYGNGRYSKGIKAKSKNPPKNKRDKRIKKGIKPLKDRKGKTYHFICKDCNKDSFLNIKTYKNYKRKKQHITCSDCTYKRKTLRENLKTLNDFLNNKFSTANNNRRKRLPPTIREYIFKKANYKCTQCGDLRFNKFNGKHINQIDHIDGNPYNNHPDNLRVLCPNCHCMTDTWGNVKKKLV